MKMVCEISHIKEVLFFLVLDMALAIITNSLFSPMLIESGFLLSLHLQSFVGRHLGSI